MPGLTPVRAFFLLGAVATVVPLTILATRPEAAPTPAPTRSPDFSLTDAEAIAEFERLNASLTAAYRTRDITLVKAFAAPGSPIAARVEREIRALLHDGVIDRTVTRQISATVVENNADEIRIEQVVLDRARFLDAASGRSVTLDSHWQRQVVLWSLKLIDSDWRLEDAVITASRPASRPQS
ncbi:MAG: hypothetical protein M3323_08285 [Actinomycetota bacterium]|nr:hypothetical protein [Actinomycetota bacterium]